MSTGSNPIYQAIASKVDARLRCLETGNSLWFERHTEALEKIAKEELPSGSGFDSGTTIEINESKADRLVLHTSYHHMDEGGGYDGWTEHDIIVTPSLIHTINIRVTGSDIRNDIKDYIADTFYDALTYYTFN